MFYFSVSVDSVSGANGQSRKGFGCRMICAVPQRKWRQRSGAGDTRQALPGGHRGCRCRAWRCLSSHRRTATTSARPTTRCWYRSLALRLRRPRLRAMQLLLPARHSWLCSWLLPDAARCFAAVPHTLAPALCVCRSPRSQSHMSRLRSSRAASVYTGCRRGSSGRRQRPPLARPPSAATAPPARKCRSRA